MIGKVVAAVLATAATTLLFAGVASTDVGGFSTVLLVNVSGTTVSVAIDGEARQPLPYGEVASPVRLPAGSHRASVDGAPAQLLSVGEGCQHLWLVKPADTSVSNRFLDVRDCPTPRPGPGRGVVRLINAAAHAGDLSMTVGSSTTAPVAPWSASRWSEVVGGSVHLALSRPGLPGIVRETDMIVAPMGAFAAVISGGGETNVLLFVIDLGRAAEDPPSEVPVNTGVPGRHASRPSAVRVLLLLLGVPLGLCRSSAARRMAVALVISLAATGCTDAPSAVNAPPSSMPPAKPGATPTTPSVPRHRTDVLLPSASVPWHLVAGAISAQVVKAIDAEEAPRLPKILTDPDAAYINGIGPGEPGAAVIVAHSQWQGEKGVFAPLVNLVPGTPVVLTMGEGRSTQWRIEQTFVAPKANLPSWLWAPNAIPILVLIGCDNTSPLDPVTGLHSRNAVAVAVSA